MGIVSSLLAACGLLGGHSDATEVQDALRGSVEALPEHLTGKVQFQDSAGAGTTISGVLVLAGADRAQIEQSLLVILETVSATYAEQPGVRTAFVRIEAHPEGDRSVRVTTADVVPPNSGANVTTEELAAHVDP